MDLDIIKNVMSSWAIENKLIDEIITFGSRARNNFKKDSDLDIALTLNTNKGDELTEWIEYCQKWKDELQKLIPFYKIHLEWNGGRKTPTIEKAIKESSILVFKRRKDE
jgi:uncharacterized protein